MLHADLVEHCLAKPGAWLDEPWEGDLVAKVADKIFAFLGSPAPDGTAGGVGLKCGRDAEAAREWRERYPGEVSVSAYIGRYGWNTFTVGGAVPDEELLEAVDASYEDVVSRLPRSRRPVSGDQLAGSAAPAREDRPGRAGAQAAAGGQGATA